MATYTPDPPKPDQALIDSNVTGTVALAFIQSYQNKHPLKTPENSDLTSHIDSMSVVDRRALVRAYFSRHGMRGGIYADESNIDRWINAVRNRPAFN